MIGGPILMLWRVLRTKADVYHFHDPELIITGLVLKLLKRKPVIFDVHEDNVTVIRQRTYIPNFFRSFLEKTYLLIEGLAHRYLTIIIAEKYYKRRLTKGHSVLNYPMIAPPKTSTLRKTKRDENAEHFLVYTGSVREDRGALNHAKLTRLNPKISVVSAGICSRELADTMSKISGNLERLTMIGVGGRKVPRKDLDELTSCHDWLAGLALFPKSEHFAEKELTKFFEYMRDGIPILCSDMPNWKEFVEKNGVGLAVDPDDNKEITRAIDWLIDHPDERADMGRKGQQLVKTEFNWEIEAQKLLQIYEDLVR